MRAARCTWRSLTLAVLLFPVASQAQAQPAITFEESAVVASGLSPGKTMVFFGVERRVDAEYSNDLYQRYQAATVAADGTARFTLEQPVALRSIWTAVDLETGNFALASPKGYRLARLAAAPSRLVAGSSSGPDEIVDNRGSLMGLVVRPGVGAWTLAGADGGPGDADGASDGRLTLALDKLEPLPGSPASPAKVGASDLWFVVDPQRMEVSVQKGGVVQ
ncbi:MAG TPA: hypothetical protein VF173_32555 [Thermoanaerobaculia bacterium]|nr:hypothetical protein [Thermoanaerobaculia bacterium]